MRDTESRINKVGKAWNRRMPNGTYGGVRGQVNTKEVNTSISVHFLLDCWIIDLKTDYIRAIVKMTIIFLSKNTTSRTQIAMRLCHIRMRRLFQRMRFLNKHFQTID